jgi:hypothetical protein
VLESKQRLHAGSAAAIRGIQQIKPPSFTGTTNSVPEDSSKLVPLRFDTHASWRSLYKFIPTAGLNFKKYGVFCFEACVVVVSLLAFTSSCTSLSGGRLEYQSPEPITPLKEKCCLGVTSSYTADITEKTGRHQQDDAHWARRTEAATTVVRVVQLASRVVWLHEAASCHLHAGISALLFEDM